MAPNSYSDPYWTQLASATEQKLGLPTGLLGSIVTHGERSNSDQVSEAGAKTPFQITPATRDAVLKRDGIDAYLSPENAAEVAGLVLKDGVNFAKQRTDDPEAQNRLAAGFYHGGGDTANWGPRTHAYVARVSDGAEGTRLQSLHDSFDAFMKANPASAPAPAPQAPPQEDTSKLHAAFDALMQSDPVAPATTVPDQPEQAPAGPGLGDQIVGAGEAGLAAVSSIPSYLALLTGGALQAGKEALYGISAHGTPEYQQNLPGTFDRISDAAHKTADHFQYQPRTPTGQDYAQSLANGLQPFAGLNPLEGSLLASGGSAMGGVARAAPAAIGDAATTGATAIREHIGRLTGEAPEATPGTLGSVGAAGVDVATERRVNADALGLPPLTKGQETRDQMQNRFEQETAKGQLGEPLRQRHADQNAAVPQKFDQLIDLTGAEQTSQSGVGRAVVDEGLVKDAAALKSKFREEYKAARESGETADPVDTDSIIGVLNDSSSADSLAPVIPAVRKELVRLGGASLSEDGTLVPGTLTVDNAETLRKFVNKATGIDPTNQKYAGDIRKAIDQATDGAGGDLYKQARQTRRRYAQLYEDNAIVADLLSNRKGTADRKVALENVFQRTVLNGSREDLSNLRRTLHVGGSEEGKQAWRELQGATLRHLIDQATGNVGTDIRGNPIVSADKLNRSIKSLDEGGKLDFILGKQGAQTVRDINAYVKLIKTTPPGSVNFSNTASVLLGHFADMKTVVGGGSEAALMGMLTGIPLPVLTTLRVGLKSAKQTIENKRIAAQVDEALGIVREKETRQRIPKKQSPAPTGAVIH